MRYVALTGGGLSAGMILAYLLDRTSCRIDSVFVECPRAPNPRPRKKQRVAQRLRRLSSHFCLARVMPRAYGFRLLERVLGVSQDEILIRVGARPRLIRYLTGISVHRELLSGLRMMDVERVARDHDIPIVRSSSFNTPQAIDAITARSPDVILGLGTGILTPEVLRVPRIGVLNGHSSILPEYRGGVTEFWQLVHGETETGVTIHWMLPDVDAGDICAQRRWPIPVGSNHHQLRLLSMFYRLEPWREVVERLEHGDVPRIPQGDPRTPTFRRPTLRMQQDFYCRRIRVAPRVSKRRG